MFDARDRLVNDLHTNFMVEASAGTGKTTSMVARMLKLLAEGECQPHQLVAVTFTRKAAAELRERFERQLVATIAELSTSDTIDDQRCRARLEQASANIHQTFVGTIHSFCTQLIRQRPIEFGVQPGFRELEADDGQLLREQAWHENLADLKAVDDPLLYELTSLGLESSQLAECFQNFVEYRDVEHCRVSQLRIST